MEKNYHEGIPSEAYLVHPEDPNKVIKVVAGEPGYYPVRFRPAEGQTGADFARFLNGYDMDPAVAEAMLVGSMFGWLVPGASPDCYRKV